MNIVGCSVQFYTFELLNVGNRFIDAYFVTFALFLSFCHFALAKNVRYLRVLIFSRTNFGVIGKLRVAIASVLRNVTAYTPFY